MIKGVIGNINGLPREKMTGAVETIDYGHHEIHEGESYTLSLNDPSLGIDETLIAAFKTPNTPNKWVHLIALVNTSGAAKFDTLEAPTITVDTGSDLTVFNRERNSTNISGVKTIETIPEVGEVTQDPTITDDGTILRTDSLGVGNNKTPGETRDVSEWILKEDTIYAFRLTSLATGNIVQMNLIWYEFINRE